MNTASAALTLGLFLGDGMPKGLYSLRPKILIEDAEQATLDAIRSIQGPVAGNVASDLMRPE